MPPYADEGKCKPPSPEFGSTILGKILAGKPRARRRSIKKEYKSKPYPIPALSRAGRQSESKPRALSQLSIGPGKRSTENKTHVSCSWNQEHSVENEF